MRVNILIGKKQYFDRKKRKKIDVLIENNEIEYQHFDRNTKTINKYSARVFANSTFFSTKLQHRTYDL